jgi:hypothetical protein
LLLSLTAYSLLVTFSSKLSYSSLENATVKTQNKESIELCALIGAGSQLPLAGCELRLAIEVANSVWSSEVQFCQGLPSFYSIAFTTWHAGTIPEFSLTFVEEYPVFHLARGWLGLGAGIILGYIQIQTDTVQHYLIDYT